MSIAVVAPEPQRQGLLPALRCAAAGHHVTTADEPDALNPEGLQLVVVDQEQAPATLQHLHAAGSKARVLVVGQAVPLSTLKLAHAYPRVIGVCGSSSGVPEPWEITYATRRVLAPNEPTPNSSQFMTWGVTNVTWNPKTTADLRRIVKQIEDIARNLGADRREAGLVATSAHELLMNAMYDAPVNDAGQPLYAFDRQADIQLSDAQRPTFRLAVGPAYLGLDVSDPFGRLARSRFFEALLRGVGGGAVDTSHGGAGLGLYTLFVNGSVLRVELRPTRETHVSWMVKRGVPHRGRDSDRSAFFVPLTEAS